jgi:serine/threonine protein kinase
MEHEERLRVALADRYEIQREIGRGGMATVYLARDIRHDRRVALKVLRSELAASLGDERFLQEVRVTANLLHPHILPLFDSGEIDGFLYYVMPFVEGESLRERLTREHELPVSEALGLLRDVVDGLAAAHKLGVVHRDIKPENVLISVRRRCYGLRTPYRTPSLFHGYGSANPGGPGHGAPPTYYGTPDFGATGLGSRHHAVLGEETGGPVAERRGAPVRARGVGNPWRRGDTS